MLNSLFIADETSSSEKWQVVRPRRGKELDIRVVAHSTVFHRPTNSLIIYGGVVAGVARFCKLSDRMFVFQLDKRVRSKIHYRRAHLRDTYVPRERAFHTCNVKGKNLYKHKNSLVSLWYWGCRLYTYLYFYAFFCRLNKF